MDSSLTNWAIKANRPNHLEGTTMNGQIVKIYYSKENNKINKQTIILLNTRLLIIYEAVPSIQ